LPHSQRNLGLNLHNGQISKHVYQTKGAMRSGSINGIGRHEKDRIRNRAECRMYNYNMTISEGWCIFVEAWFWSKFAICITFHVIYIVFLGLSISYFIFQQNIS
jgi:hypothetical protein